VFDAIVEAEGDETVQAVIIRGSGKLFSARADIGEFAEPEQEPGLSALIDRIESCSKPVVAATHGNCLGGGLELAMGCHYRVAARNSRMALPEVTLGLLPGAGGTQRLPGLVGVAKALDKIMTESAIAAEQALEMGLVDLLADDGNIAAVASEFARSLSGARRTRDIEHDLVITRGNRLGSEMQRLLA
jgi:3-hydroxyacyl-CoA dehydrogenase